MRSLGDALKETRRRVHQHGANWRVLVAVKSHSQVKPAFEEVLRILEASSLSVESSSRSANGTYIQLEKGAMISFAAITDSMDVYALASKVFRHIIWLYDPAPKIYDYAITLLRSNGVIPVEHLVSEVVDW